MLIRSVRESDAQALLSIYAPYVTGTAVTFEWETPTEEEFRRRIKGISERYPYLVLENQGRIQGYAYASSFKGRAAYDWAVETTIYLSPSSRGKGYGKALYEALEKELARRHFLNAYACISFLEDADPYLTQASPRFHAKMGYTRCGTFHRCGYKFGRWYDMIWMEKSLGEHDKNPLPILWQGETEE